jgi:response regulator RpfG family c-di-GMP phosphodiesterase
MGEPILLVDDDATVLDLYERTLAENHFVIAASGAAEALGFLTGGIQPALVISDHNMPEVSGTEFLAQCAELLPRSVRILITGQASLDAAIDAINEGHVFMFLTKPCPAGRLRLAVQRGLQQYRLQNAERDLLEQTLNGSVKLLTDILAVVSPAAFGHATRISRLTGELAKRLGMPAAWYFELAALLSQTGTVALPDEVVQRALHLAELAPFEEEQFAGHPSIGSGLVSRIPRLEEAARIIDLQRARYDGAGGSHPNVAGEQIPLGARILHAAADYDLLVSNGMAPLSALAELNRRSGQYDPRVLHELANYVRDEMGYEVRMLSLAQIEVGMVLAEGVISPSGVLLVGRGQDVTPALKARLVTLEQVFSTRRLFKVIVPSKHPSLAQP